MSALAITPAGMLTVFAAFVALIAVAGSALVWWSLRSQRGRRERDGGPVIDLAYLEQAIRADEEATARRDAEDRPLLSQASSTHRNRRHRLPTNGQYGP